MTHRFNRSPNFLAEIEAVVALWNDPKTERSVAQIAKALNMTNGKVIGIVHRNRDRCPYRVSAADRKARNETRRMNLAG